MTPPFDRVLTAAREGEAWACARIYEDLKKPVVTYVRMRGAKDPDDVTSETFLGVFRDLDTFEGDEQDFRAWVFTIAHRRLIDAWRKRQRRPAETELDPSLDLAGGDTEGDAMATLGLTDIATLLDELTEDQRDVVLLRTVADLSLEEVADVMDRSVSAVKALQHRALAALRKAIDEPPASPRGWRAIWGTR